MIRINRKTQKLLFSSIVAGCYILSALVIPALHRLEIFHSHDNCGAGECRHEHNNDGQVQIKTCDSPTQSHDSEQCPICFFSKYLSGIKDFTLFPSGKTFIRTVNILTPPVEILETGFIQFCFASRAPPL